MNFSAYRYGPESIFFHEPDWEAKYWKVAIERNRAHERIHALEQHMERAKDKLSQQEYGDTCVIPGCAYRRASGVQLPLCPDCLEVSYRDTLAMWREMWKAYPERVPVDLTESLGVQEGRPWVVYYIAMGARVKIGRTVDPVKRMRTFSALPDQLLAIEPGVEVDGTDRERQRHREFAKWRVPGTELFERSPELDAHIETVVATFGDPQQYLAPEAA